MSTDSISNAFERMSSLCHDWSSKRDPDHECETVAPILFSLSMLGEESSGSFPSVEPPPYAHASLPFDPLENMAESFPSRIFNDDGTTPVS